MTRTSMIFRDILYALMITLLLVPGNVPGLPIWLKVLIIVMAVGMRVWQHVVYYRLTGKIY
ncbi:hypothetical protein DJ568_12295 [Mucilaginibacter hurinus]|uniref:Uncharacterized protein n=1 Tax=Mucilaginibacter hurinus TaxID=2201324 RepID=A0A367GPI2_9SPHI|nr:hypothetical protein [Mucilaginibacter hurinus]RCH54593.1 hypothetical protein DJ568_12295 [Mucilaginibacter hurinus]